MPAFFLTGDIMAGHRNSSLVTIRRNFNETESPANSLYTARLHQNNDNAQDESLPLFATLFF